MTSSQIFPLLISYYFPRRSSSGAMFITLSMYVAVISFSAAFRDLDDFPGSVPCSRGWYYWGNKCYKTGGRKNHERFTWERALRRCKSYGGDLVSIGSQEEQDFVVTFLQLELKAWAWIGLNDREKEEDYKWSDGTVFNYTNWVKNQPLPGHTEPEDCGHLWFEPEHNLIGYWNDLHCDSKERYICEMDSNPLARSQSLNPMFCSSEGHKGWKWGDSCYHIVTLKESWKDAERHCKSYYNGHLVSILDILEDAFLDYLVSKEEEELWIGIEIKEQWQQKWTSGWYVAYNGFAKNVNFREGTCAARKKRKEWIATSCHKELPFICKVSKENPPVLKPPEKDSHCPIDFEGWRDLGGEYCYYFETEKSLTFQDASFECKRKGGNLVSLHSKEENDMLLPFVKYHPAGRTFFIGLFRLFPREDEFAWTDGSAVDYENWQLNEPNDLDEKCVEVIAQDNPREESNVIPFSWNDNSCWMKNSFICSVKKIPLKSTEDDDCSSYCISRSSYLLELINQSPDAKRLP